MLRPYDLLENILIDIEKDIREDVDVASLAEKYTLSDRHLRRLFKFAFKQPLANYIRSRRLAASLEDLLKTDLHIADIALDYGFCYEQSYINAFKREFGITPGDLRKSRHIVKVKPPLHLFDENKLADGLIFGPDIVMVPQFHAVGKKHKMSHSDSVFVTEYLAKHFCYLVEQFCLNERQSISNVMDNDVHINISTRADENADYFYFMPSIQVKTLKNIPKGFDYYTFPTSLCARFHFINHNSGIPNMHIADGMFQAIHNFMDSKDQKYLLERNRINIDKFYSPDKNGYRLWEWFTPIVNKLHLST